MSSSPTRFDRWLDADAGYRADEADAAFRVAYQTTMADQPVSLDFAARTMSAVAAASASDVRRTRRVRATVITGTIAVTLAALYYGAGWAVSVMSAAFVGLLNLAVAATVRGATGGGQGGSGVWSFLSSLGRAAAAFAADPNVTFAMIAISAIAIAALVALQRLLGSDEESFQ
jgi:hypothetical protein